MNAGKPQDKKELTKSSGEKSASHQKNMSPEERIRELEAECKGCSRLAEERLNELLYLRADFENLQKRVEREKAETVKHANEKIVAEMLGVLDSLEKAVESEKDAKVADGLQSIHKQFYGILEKNGLGRINAVGSKFNPYYHDAVLKEDSEREEGVVIGELQAGYTFNSRVIRHAKVKVSGGKENG